MQRQQAQQILDGQPEEFDLDAFVDRLYLLQELAESERQISTGEVIEHEEVKRRLGRWLD
jgi:hypothetical protein